jgi:hypothetical protein
MSRRVMDDSNQCSVCGRRLRNAVFCQRCGSSLCSWECYNKHRGERLARQSRERDSDAPLAALQSGLL